MNKNSRKINLKYQYIGFLPSTVRIKENGYWGINDYDGNEILPSNFIEVFTLSSGYGLIAAREAGFYNIYDLRGTKLNSQPFEDLYQYYGMFGITKVKLKGKWGILNKFGELVIKPEYEKIEQFGKGIFLLKDNGTTEFYDRFQLNKIIKSNKQLETIIPRTPVRKRIIKIRSIKKQGID